MINDMAKRENKKKTSYCPPRVLQTVEVMLEEGLLAASNLGIEATGQEVEVVENSQTWID